MKDKLKNDLKTAMKEKDTLTKDVLRLIIANVEKEQIQLQHELSNDEVIKVVKREFKQTKDALDGAKQANRNDLIAKEMSKLSIIEKYLPKMLNEDEIVSILNKKGAQKGMNMGQLMGMVMKDHKSEVDGALVKKVITENFI